MHNTGFEDWWWSSFGVSSEERRQIKEAFRDLWHLSRRKKWSQRLMEYLGLTKREEPTPETVAVAQSEMLGPILKSYVIMFA